MNRRGLQRGQSPLAGNVTCLAVFLGLALAVPSTLAAATVAVELPNPSFELPSTVFVSTDIDAWKKAPKPDDYDEAGGFLWDQLAGVFRNTAPGKPDHIVNCDGSQAMYLFADAHVGVFLDPAAPDGTFPATFDVGTSVVLTVAVFGGGGNMREGTPLRLELLHFNGSGERQVVEGLTVLHSAEQFPTTTRFFDFQVITPVVKATDPWAGSAIGIGIRSAVDPQSEIKGGYWDLDNVRLSITREDAFQLVPSVVNGDGGMQVSWPGDSGSQYQVQVCADLGSWTDSGALIPGTGGELMVTLPPAAGDATFVRVVSSPRP